MSLRTVFLSSVVVIDYRWYLRHASAALYANKRYFDKFVCTVISYMPYVLRVPTIVGRSGFYPSTDRIVMIVKNLLPALRALPASVVFDQLLCAVSYLVLKVAYKYLTFILNCEFCWSKSCFIVIIRLKIGRVQT